MIWTSHFNPASLSFSAVCTSPDEFDTNINQGCAVCHLWISMKNIFINHNLQCLLRAFENPKSSPKIQYPILCHCVWVFGAGLYIRKILSNLCNTPAARAGTGEGRGRSRSRREREREQIPKTTIPHLSTFITNQMSKLKFIKIKNLNSPPFRCWRRDRCGWYKSHKVIPLMNETFSLSKFHWGTHAAPSDRETECVSLPLLLLVGFDARTENIVNRCASSSPRHPPPNPSPVPRRPFHPALVRLPIKMWVSVLCHSVANRMAVPSLRNFPHHHHHHQQLRMMSSCMAIIVRPNLI